LEFLYLAYFFSITPLFPIGDIAIINTIRESTNTNLKDNILALSENWKPLRSLAPYFL